MWRGRCGKGTGPSVCYTSSRGRMKHGGSSTPPRAPPNNGMQRSADTQVVMFLQRGFAPAHAERYAASSYVSLKHPGLTMAEDKLLEEKLNFLRLELSNLTTKINGTVDAIWKIRSAEFLLWAAAVGYALPKDSKDTPRVSLFLITLLIPLWFYWIDAKYNQWYRRLASRERFIQHFLNSEEFERVVRDGNTSFPVYDVSGESTFVGDKEFEWHTSLLRSWVDTTPMFIYGGQMLVSASLTAIYGSFIWWGIEWKSSFMVGVIIFFGLLVIVAKRKQQRLVKARPAA